MKKLLLFTLLLLAVLIVGPAAEVRAQSPTPKPTETPAVEATTSTTGSGASATATADVTATTPTSAPFAVRMNSLGPSESTDLKVAPEAVNNACFPESDFRAYGFYVLGNNAKPVNFSVYSRIQYYSLTPKWDGNIETPKNWQRAQVTEAAQRHGSKVDLVISNKGWWLSDEDGSPDVDNPYFDPDGLWLTKSYVLLTLIDDIVDLVSVHNFDGVTLDFRLPPDPDIVESYTFLVNRLKKSLEKEGPTDSDLLKSGPKKLNIVIDRAFARSIYSADLIRLQARQENVSYKLTPEDETLSGLNDDGQIKYGLEQIVEEMSASIDSLLIENPSESTDPLAAGQVKQALLNASTPSPVHVRVLPNDALFTADQLGSDPVGIWDVPTGEAGKELNAALQQKVGLGLKDNIFGLVCISREKIAGALSGLTPVLALLVLVSWVFYDFPPRIKRSTSNLVIWGLLAITFVAFVLLWIGLPSHNLKSIYLWVIISAFVIPLLYLIWSLVTRAGKQNYP